MDTDTWKDKFPKENRYFETDNGILYCGDSKEILKKFPKESIDLVVTDPPYNIADNNKLTKVGEIYVSNKDAWGNKFRDKWNNIEEYYNWLLKILSEIYSLLKVNGNLISFFDRKYTGLFVYKLENDLNLIFRNKIYFEKLNPVPHIRKNNYLSCIEEAIWFSKNSKYKFNFISQRDMKQIFKGNIGNKETTHPTEKYFWMIIPLILRHSNKNDIVLDPFMGSGTTAVACEQTGRRWIGIEISKEYCEIAKKRIQNEVQQKRLFY